MKKRGGAKPRPLKVSRFFSVSTEDYLATGERDAILASSGMGKSYLTGVLAEETLEGGGLLCVIDPEGEYYTLAERYPMLIVGGENAMVPISEEAIDLYVQTMLEANISVVFDLSDFLDDEQQQLYAHIASSLFQQQTTIRKKVRVIIEEAQIYAPQRMASGGSRGKKKLDPVNASQKLAKRGRKRAIDTLWATQRPASLSKDILSQCNRFWFGGITAEQDYKAIKPFLNEAGISFNDIKTLQPGEFYFYSKGFTKLIKSRKRLCNHAGATPEAQQSFAAMTNAGLQKAVESLAAAIELRQQEKKEELSEIKQLKKEIKELKVHNDALMEELEQERTATKVIKRIKVEDTATSPAKKKSRGTAKAKAKTPLKAKDPAIASDSASPQPLPVEVAMPTASELPPAKDKESVAITVEDKPLPTVTEG